MITFDHSGLFGESGERDVNGIVIDLVERNSAHHRLVSNVVNQCAQAISDWDFRVCRLTMNHAVMVYDQNGDPSRFGDDCDISDKIMQEGDILILLEGGAQSLLQTFNALSQGVSVIALEGLREEGPTKFSAARFFRQVCQEPEKNPVTHLEDQIRRQTDWKPNKTVLLDKAR